MEDLELLATDLQRIIILGRVSQGFPKFHIPVRAAIGFCDSVPNNVLEHAC